VVFGAGRIACASLGLTLAGAGHDVVLVNRDGMVGDRINAHRGYVVRTGENGRYTQQWVRGVRAIRITEHDRVVAEVAQAELVATAVGAGNLPAIANALAAGLDRAAGPINVVAFENGPDAGPALRRLVLSSSVDRRSAARHGFASGLALRIVADRSLPIDRAHPLSFLADRDPRLLVDRTGLMTDLPVAEGLRAVGAYPVWVRAKLFTLNAAHAAAGYLGYLKGYRSVHAAVRDPQIRPLVRAVATLGRDGIAARCPRAPLPEPDAVLRRLDNALLNDQIARVARDPLRKLARGERLVGAARWATDVGLDAAPLALVIAAAIRYARDHDLGHPETTRILRDVCGLDPHSGTGLLVAEHARRIAGVPTGALMLDLTRMSWTWRAAPTAA
jgi:mannitol-1-phosphate 5-dehydrogenase